jgi:hypothetical protein
LVGNLSINVTLTTFCANIVAVEKTISITYSECVTVAVGIQHAMSKNHIVIRGVSKSSVNGTRKQTKQKIQTN